MGSLESQPYLEIACANIWFGQCARRPSYIAAEDSLAEVGLEFEVSSFDPCLFFVYRRDGGAVGDFATRIDDILGRGAWGVPSKTRAFLELRFGKLKVQESPFARAGV